MKPSDDIETKRHQVFLEALFKYIGDEYKGLSKPSPNFEDWEFKVDEESTPRQRNGFDCGVFVCMFADYLFKSKTLQFSQEDVTDYRRKMKADIKTMANL